MPINPPTHTHPLTPTHTQTFGESILNDAVSIVLFRSLAAFLHRPAGGADAARAAATFAGIFMGSMALGSGVGFALSLATKGGHCRSHHQPLESSLVVLGG